MGEIIKDDKFFDVPRVSVPTSTGEVELPILYYAVDNFTFLFAADFKQVTDKLRAFGLKPGLRWGKRAVVGLAFYKYRKTSIGPYYEAGLAIPALLEHDRRPFSGWLDLFSNLRTRRTGFLILNLPVSTETAWAAGREIWGYPKFVTGFKVELVNNYFHGIVREPGTQNPIVTVKGNLGLGIPGPPMSLLLYSQLGGKRLASIVNVRGVVRVGHKGGLRLEIGDSEHGMAQNLRDLGLDNAQPIITMSTQRFQSRLNQGEEIKPPSGGNN